MDSTSSMQYILVIKLMYICTSGLSLEREKVFSSKEYTKAVQVYNELYNKIGNDEVIDDKLCVLNEVRAGKRVRK